DLHLFLLVEIALPGLRSLESELFVDDLLADVVGVPFDLDVDVLRILFEVGDHLVDLRLRLVRQHGLPELEVARILAQHDLVNQALAGLVDHVELAVGVVARLGRGLLRLLRRAVGLLRRLRRRLRLLIDFADPAFVLARALLRFLERTTHRVHLVVHFPDAGPHELLARARRRATSGQHDDGKGHKEFPQHAYPPKWAGWIPPPYTRSAL